VSSSTFIASAAPRLQACTTTIEWVLSSSNQISQTHTSEGVAQSKMVSGHLRGFHNCHDYYARVQTKTLSCSFQDVSGAVGPVTKMDESRRIGAGRNTVQGHVSSKSNHRARLVLAPHITVLPHLYLDVFLLDSYEYHCRFYGEHIRHSRKGHRGRRTSYRLHLISLFFKSSRLPRSWQLG